MAEICVSVASHHFVVTRINPRARPAVEDFAKSLIHYGFMRGRGGSFQRTPLKVFAAATRSRNEYRFHINHFDKFKETLRKFFIHDGMVEWVKLEPKPALVVELPFKPHWTDAEHQIPVIEYANNPEGPVSRLIEMQTGKGKTYCALRAVAFWEKLGIIIIKPSYIPKWVSDVKGAYDIKDKEIVTVTGSKQLMSILNMAEDGDLPYKLIIISNKTYQNWLKLYELHQKDILDMGYACLPQDLFSHCKAGFRLIDEVHQDFHLNFKCDLYTNVARSLSLSATLISDNDFITRMYEVAYPKHLRYQGGAYDKYINAYSLFYRFANPERIRFTEYGSTTYSHHVFEQCVIKNTKVFANYMLMIESAMGNTYFKNYKPGQRCLIFCTSIDMCTRVTDYLKKKFPNKDVRRYCEEDPYENIMEAEISVSTLQSAGTAIDIDKLATVILTSAVNSSQSNIQGFGRLRKPKDGSSPEFVYFVCEDIIKHMDYHDRKKELLASRALTYTQRLYTAMI